MAGGTKVQLRTPSSCTDKLLHELRPPLNFSCRPLCDHGLMSKRIKNFALMMIVTKVADKLLERYGDDQIVKDARTGGKAARKGSGKAAKGGAAVAGKIKHKATAKKRAAESKKRKRMGAGVAATALTALAVLKLRKK